MPSLRSTSDHHHAQLLPHVERLLVLADMVGQVDCSGIHAMFEEEYEFIVGQLVPHMEAVERTLYDRLEELMGGRHSMAPMRQEHEVVKRLVEELGGYRRHADGCRWSSIEGMALRRALYRLHSILKVHLAEEELYLGVLEQGLGEEEKAELARGIDHATAAPLWLTRGLSGRAAADGHPLEIARLELGAQAGPLLHDGGPLVERAVSARGQLVLAARRPCPGGPGRADQARLLELSERAVDLADIDRPARHPELLELAHDRVAVHGAAGEQGHDERLHPTVAADGRPAPVDRHAGRVAARGDGVAPLARRRQAGTIRRQVRQVRRLGVRGGPIQAVRIHMPPEHRGSGLALGRQAGQLAITGCSSAAASTSATSASTPRSTIRR
jgi:hypothetical protein